MLSVAWICFGFFFVWRKRIEWPRNTNHLELKPLGSDSSRRNQFESLYWGKEAKEQTANVCPGKYGLGWISCIIMWHVIWRESKCSFWHPLLSINQENHRPALPFPSRHCGLMSAAAPLICVSNGKDTPTLSASFVSSVTTVQPKPCFWSQTLKGRSTERPLVVPNRKCSVVHR